MRYLLRLLILAAVAGVAGGAGAAERLRVVASTPDLQSLTQAVGGDLVSVESLARGTQNFHDVEVRPSLMAKLRRADLLIMNGLDLDYWVEPLVRGANNPRLVPGGPGRVDASRGIAALEVPAGRIDRSMGDVHPSGNPHYLLDPENAVTVTATIADALARAAPEHRPTFERRRQAFVDQLQAAQARWKQALAPFAGARVVVYHNTWPYFLSRFGLVQAATVEDRPGIPPSPGHLAALIRQMKAERIRALIVEPWSDRRLAERVAAETGARVVVLAHTVGAVEGADSYLGVFDHNVAALAAALGS